MKFSAALSLAIAPLALAKSVHNVYPLRRSAEPKPDEHFESKRAKVLQSGLRGFGVTNTELAEVVVIWVNPGLGAATTLINAPQTVTKTVVAAAGSTAPPTGTQNGNPSQVSGIAGASGSVVPSTGKNHSVTVGGSAAKLTFDPAEIQAAPGDQVIFTFLSANHTATQSAFDTPCNPLAQGFDSGFQPNANNSVNPPPQIAMQVMVTTPVWFFCRQAGHCGKGMTFAINPTQAKSQAMFQAMAIQQAGSGSGSVITGNGGSSAAPPAAAPPASSSVDTGAASAATSLTATLGAAGAQTATAVAGSASTVATGANGVTGGVGTVNADGTCSCFVVCNAGGSGAFPAVAQGNGNFGGLGGAIPMASAMAGISAATAAAAPPARR